MKEYWMLLQNSYPRRARVGGNKYTHPRRARVGGKKHKQSPLWPGETMKHSDLSIFIPWCIPFDTKVIVSIWLYLGQRELHNTYESETVYTNTTFIRSIQGQYTETGTLHSWAVYGDSIQRPRQLLHSNESAVYEDCIRNQSTQGQHIIFIDGIHWLYTGTKHTRFYSKREKGNKHDGHVNILYVIRKISWLHTLQHLTQCYNNCRDAVHRNNRATHTNDVHTHGLLCLE